MKILLNSRIVFILSVFLLFACSGADDKELVVSAKKYMENNQLREANLELKNALQANPKNAEARYLLGQINITIGDMKSAAKEFRKAQEAGWEESQAQIGLMKALVNSREFEKVLDGVQIKESYSANARADLYGLKAFAEAASGYAGLANESIKLGAALDKDAFHILKTSIQLKITSGKMDTAATQLSHALTLYKNNSELLLLNAYLAMQSKESLIAAEQFRKIISLDPENFVTFDGRKARLGLARLEIVNKNLDDAKALLAPLFKQNANDPELNYIGGLLSFEQADFDKAEERLLKVLKVAPEHAKSQLLFGTVNFAQKDYEQAAYYISQYLQLEPENIGARKLLGRTYILMGQHAEAQAALQSGQQGSENDAELLGLVGMSQLQGGDITSGITDLEKAVDITPESKALRSELAKAYISAGETENAIKQLNKILAEGGNRNQAEVLMVSAYLRAKQYDQAINVALDILERSPKDAIVITLVGNVFAASGDRDEARKYFDQALKIEPENVQATMLLASLEEIEGSSEKAAALYKKLTESDSKSIDPFFALARLAEKSQDYEKMVFWLEEAGKKEPIDIRPKKALAEYYLRNNQFDKVEILVKEALDISSKDPALLLLKARLLVAQQRFNEALSLLKELITRSPESVYMRTLLGETYLKLEQLEDARRQLTIVLDRQPYYVPALLVIAGTEQSSGNYEQALEYIQRAQKTQPDQYMIYVLGGDIAMQAKKYKEASEFYKQVMSIRPSSEIVVKQSEAWLRLSETEQAINALQSWLINHENDTRVRQFLGNAYLAKGENVKAIEAYESVIEVQPDNVVTLNNLAWLYSLKSDPRALMFAEKAYKVRSNDSGIQDTYGWILVQQGQVEEGRRILEKAMNELSAVPDVRYHYAVALMKTGEENKARKIFTELLESDESFEGRENVEQLMK